jgi:hypothetical protein
MLPLPKPTPAEVDGSRTLLSMNDSACFVNANASGAKLELAKKLLRFCHSENSLKSFNKIVGMSKPYDYTMSDADLSETSFFAADIYRAHKTADVVYPYADTPAFIKNQQFFAALNVGCASTVSGTNYENPLWTFHDNKSLTAKQYFDGMLTFHQNRWNTLQV